MRRTHISRTYCLADKKAVALSAATDRDFPLYDMPTVRYPPPPTRARRGTVDVFESSKLLTEAPPSAARCIRIHEFRIVN